jgi:hypothetical protein
VEYAFDANGIFNVTLTVTDDMGVEDFIICPVSIEPPPVEPNADPGGPYDYCQGIDREFFLDGSGSYDPDNAPCTPGAGIISHSWELDFSEFPYDFNEAFGDVVDAKDFYDGLGAGTYNVGLRVTDDEGEVGEDFTTVSVWDDPIHCPHPPRPTAVCPLDQVWECEEDLHGSGVLDGSGSSDPLERDLTFRWDSESCAIDDPNAAMTTVSCTLGKNTVRLTVTNPDGETDACSVQVTVLDTQPPKGEITAPEDGNCHGGPVTVTDDFTDACDPGSLTRTYTPEGGPVYQEHGDYEVVLQVTDGSGNTSTDRVSFTIDTIPPVVEIQEQEDGKLFPRTIPFQVLFVATDDDGAAGGPVHETVLLDDCTLFDGWTYGNGDGLLQDEILVVDMDLLCGIVETCGQSEWVQPTITVAVTDCGGNTGYDSRTMPGSIQVREGVCP